MPSRIPQPLIRVLGLLVLSSSIASVSAQTTTDAPPPIGKPVAVRGALPPSVYAAYPYGYVYNPHRAYRQGMRYSYPPVFQTWPRVPTMVYAYPYYGAYAPGYVRPMVPTMISPEESPQPSPPATNQSPSTLEPIPAPAGEPGS